MMEKLPLHDEVSRHYTDALARSRKGAGGCCGERKGDVVAKLAPYDEGAERFPEAAQSSFGCGNPLAFAGVREGQTVLDLGSGAGLDLLIAAERVGATGRVIGVDMTEAMIDAARAAVERAGLTTVEVRRGLIEDLPVSDASVDWVISNCVINLSPRKGAVFAEIRRVLRPGGRISISDIVAQDLPEVVRTSAAAHAACVAGAISEEEYVAGLRGVGLVDVTVTERIVYDAAQIRALVAEELTGCGADLGALAPLIESVAGNVWSARFEGRVPDSPASPGA